MPKSNYGFVLSLVDHNTLIEEANLMREIARFRHDAAEDATFAVAMGDIKSAYFDFRGYPYLEIQN